MIKFFKFHWICTDNGQIVDQNNGVYYTSSGQVEISEMRKLIQTEKIDPAAIISFPLVEEITKEEYEFFTKKPFPL